MQKLLVLTSPNSSDATEQIIALAKQLGYRLVASTKVENGESRMFDPTPLGQITTLPPYKRYFHGSVEGLSLGDAQRLSVLDAWRLLGGCTRTSLTSGPEGGGYKGDTMFREVSAAMAARGLRFADQAPIWPFYPLLRWKSELGLESRIASVLVANQVPDPSLLRRLTDDDLDCRLDRAGKSTRDVIAELRDRIRVAP